MVFWDTLPLYKHPPNVQYKANFTHFIATTNSGVIEGLGLFKQGVSHEV